VVDIDIYHQTFFLSLKFSPLLFKFPLIPLVFLVIVLGACFSFLVFEGCMNKSLPREGDYVLVSTGEHRL
jgi:hypothetical protein